MSKTAGMTQREAAYLEHRRRAAAEHLSLSEYCRRNALRVGEWYQVQRGLRRKAALSRRGGDEGSGGRFAPVRVTGGAMVAAAAMPMGCRIRLPSGWTLECATLPPASWLNDVVAGAR